MKYLLLPIVLTAIFNNAGAQGCVAIRSNGAVCTMTGDEHTAIEHPNRWTLGINTRYFRSYKHFVGKEEQKERVEHGTEVINHSFATELSLTRHLGQRWSVALAVPVVSNVRSSMYEHYGNGSTHPNARRNTKSFGLGDIKFTAYYWLTDPVKKNRLNVQAGLGIKLATGDYRYTDFFWRNDSTKILGPVDQSIQPGDGGTGISTEVNIFYRFAQRLGIYGNGYYLFNPREQNGVSTARGGTPSATAVAYGSDVMSVPDQYMFRLGANLSVKRFMFSGGLRIEGLPSEDIIGGSNGFRRPGYVLSAEPVIAYTTGGAQLYISVPFAIERNRVQSVPDKLRTARTGVYAQGDAAFADYSVNFGVSLPLGK